MQTFRLIYIRLLLTLAATEQQRRRGRSRYRLAVHVHLSQLREVQAPARRPFIIIACKLHFTIDSHIVNVVRKTLSPQTYGF